MTEQHKQLVMRCDSCRYWDRTGREHLEVCDDPDDKSGCCRRYPPVRDMDWSKHVDEPNWIEAACEDWRAWDQPVTTGCCWCGEYVPA